jgi:phenylpropionate dioxygenase-like ring-hydroxylating dioxygenase large terminal subunit
VRVFPNRCAHKGTKLVSAVHGKCQAATVRCPYHGWTYRLDGTLRTVPLKSGYDGTGFESSPAAQGLVEVLSENYRGFVFARLAPDGPDFREFFGDSLSSVDNMVDRSPHRYGTVRDSRDVRGDERSADAGPVPGLGRLHDSRRSGGAL